MEDMFSILIIPHAEKKYPAVTFTDDSFGYDKIYAFGALSGTILNANANGEVMKELEGVLGTFGKVIMPFCAASDYWHKNVIGAEKYFQMTCEVHDDIITLRNIDKLNRTAEIIVLTPVFRLDVKKVFLAKHIGSCFKNNYKMDAWMEYLKKMADEHLEISDIMADEHLNLSFERTAKILRNKGQIDYTRGVSREQRAINRRKKLESTLLSSGGNGKECMSRTRRRRRKQGRIIYDQEVAKANFEKRLLELDEERFGEVLCDREISAFEEIPFGDIVKPHCADDVVLSSIVVSLALFDGDKMLFVCSGIPLPSGTTRVHLTRFVTSARLVRAFMDYRNRDDKFRVAVRLPDNKITDGFLGLYDDDIAIVTCLHRMNVKPIDVNFKETDTCSDDERLLAAGRAYKSGSLMATHGSLYIKRSNTWVPESRFMSKAVLGGPLLGADRRFIGMIIDFYDRGDGIERYSFLPLGLLCDRLKHFQILNPEKLDFRGYSLPKGVRSIVPSGFMKVFYRIRACGYPIPPPLVLEFNGVLINGFEERFGHVIAWKGYPYCSPSISRASGERVWHLFDKKVMRDISRRVVSLASFKGYVRYFACTGLFIKFKCHGSKATRTVILTSASLVRTHGDGKIDNTLKIDVFLPPNQRGCGTLELYNLNYNIAIVSVENFNAVRAEDIFCSSMLRPSEEVVAIGRDTYHGPLMGSLGEVKLSNKDCELDCKDLKFSTCKISKAGIGGPLVNFNGRFIGMNFYDGSGLTPFLPRQKIVEVLSLVNDLPLEWGHGNPVPIPAHPGTKENRWPVPEPYWYHGQLDVDISYVPKLRGRTLN